MRISFARLVEALAVAGVAGYVGYKAPGLWPALAMLLAGALVGEVATTGIFRAVRRKLLTGLPLLAAAGAAAALMYVRPHEIGLGGFAVSLDWQKLLGPVDATGYNPFGLFQQGVAAGIVFYILYQTERFFRGFDTAVAATLPVPPVAAVVEGDIIRTSGALAKPAKGEQPVAAAVPNRPKPDFSRMTMREEDGKLVFYIPSADATPAAATAAKPGDTVPTTAQIAPPVAAKVVPADIAPPVAAAKVVPGDDDTPPTIEAHEGRIKIWFTEEGELLKIRVLSNGLTNKQLRDKGTGLSPRLQKIAGVEFVDEKNFGNQVKQVTLKATGDHAVIEAAMREVSNDERYA